MFYRNLSLLPILCICFAVEARLISDQQDTAPVVMCSKKGQLDQQARGRVRMKALNWLSVGVCNPLGFRDRGRDTEQPAQDINVHKCMHILLSWSVSSEIICSVCSARDMDRP